MTVEIGKCYASKKEHRIHFYKFLNDRVIHTNSYFIMHVMFYNDPHLFPHLQFNKDNTITISDSYPTLKDIEEMQSELFEITLVRCLEAIRIFDVIDVKKLFDASRNRVEKLEDLR